MSSTNTHTQTDTQVHKLIINAQFVVLDLAERTGQEEQDADQRFIGIIG